MHKTSDSEADLEEARVAGRVRRPGNKRAAQNTNANEKITAREAHLQLRAQLRRLNLQWALLRRQHFRGSLLRRRPAQHTRALATHARRRDTRQARSQHAALEEVSRA